MAFVLVNAEVGAEDEILEALEAIPQVKEAHLVYCVYDIIARVEAETRDELKDAINSKIRSIGHIRSTLTLICMLN